MLGRPVAARGVTDRVRHEQQDRYQQRSPQATSATSRSDVLVPPADQQPAGHTRNGEVQRGELHDLAHRWLDMRPRSEREGTNSHAAAGSGFRLPT